jgi:DNA-binding beta-propeller fold protein YncE
MRNCARTFLAVLISLAALALFAAPQIDYKVINKVTLGGEGGWDYLMVDAAARRIYISRGTHVMVVDADSLKQVGDIPETPGVHGIAIADDLHRGFTSNGQANTVTVFDPKTLNKIGEPIAVGTNPDAILYDPASKRVFTMNGRSHDTTAVDAASGKVVGTLPLGGKPEFAQADGAGHVFVNIEDTSEIVQFDAKNLKEMNRWKLAPCEGPSGLALDNKAHRLFAVCGNKLMAVMDATNGKIITTLPIGAGTDAAAFDPATKLAFASCGGGTGTITIVREDSPDKFTVVGDVETAPRARTMTFDPKTHNLFTVTAQFNPAPAPTAENPRPRPAMVPGSFVLIELGQGQPGSTK